MEFEQVAVVLDAVRRAEDAGERLDLNRLATELGMSDGAAQMVAERVDACGLAWTGLFEEEVSVPRLRRAGQQYFDMHGEVKPDVLNFLPAVVDDLHAREALLHAGTVMVDEFRYALLHGNEVAHAQEVVPPAFAAAVDKRLAIDLFAACVALMARRSAGEPAACVAEEIVAVELISQAQSWLEMSAGSGGISKEDQEGAAGELHGVFELFQDDDVLDLFEMAEPADAAVAGHSARNAQLGVVDQRISAWFEPFGTAAATGYIGE